MSVPAANHQRTASITRRHMRLRHRWLASFALCFFGSNAAILCDLHCTHTSGVIKWPALRTLVGPYLIILIAYLTAGQSTCGYIICRDYISLCTDALSLACLVNRGEGKGFSYILTAASALPTFTGTREGDVLSAPPAEYFMWIHYVILDFWWLVSASQWNCHLSWIFIRSHLRHQCYLSFEFSIIFANYGQLS